MKKYIIPIVIVVVFAFYILLSSRNSNTTGTPAITDNTTSTDVVTPDNTGAGTSTTGTGSGGAYKDGTYTGPVADAFYGPLQVAAVIKGGKITDVAFLKVPNDQEESQQVNGRSSPILKQEAIAAQSANVDIVSGATQSSEAFRQSLAAALTRAKS